MTDSREKHGAIISTDLFEGAELVESRDAWRAPGVEVAVYSTRSDSIQSVQGDTDKDLTVEVDGTLDDLDVDAVDSVVVPGGTAR